jgi:hypothetical protein
MKNKKPIWATDRCVKYQHGRCTVYKEYSCKLCNEDEYDVVTYLNVLVDIRNYKIYKTKHGHSEINKVNDEINEIIDKYNLPFEYAKGYEEMEKYTGR